MNNQKIKVYLQYPWKFPDSPYYKYLIKDSPKNIEFLNTQKQKGVITSKKFFWFSNFLKKWIRKSLRIFYPAMLNSHKSPEGNYDLIHCAHCLSKNKNKPWVADFEAYWQFWVSTKKTKRGLKKVKKILKRKNCKRILPWTEKIEKELLEFFPEIKEKIELVRPAVPLKIKSKKIGKEITLIFSGRYFFQKGGLHALEAIDQLTKKFPNIGGIINSEIPIEIKRKYSKNKKISFYGLMPQEKLFDLYKKANILIYPGYTDSFGFAYLEAMSFGIPIITIDGWSRKELVSEGKTGFVIERPEKFSWDKIENIEQEIIKKIIDKASLLIKDKGLLNEMSKNCIKEISFGKFSIKERNKKLKKIYGEALE
jgi:glycosyltransferase involved in cell wall biosynthesis